MDDPRIAYRVRRPDDVRLHAIRTDEPLWGADSLAVREALANLPASRQKGTDR